MKHAMMIFLTICGLMVAAHAENNGKKGGDGFRKAAVDYDTKAAAAFKGGYGEIAKCFRQMAAIKRNAAALADQNKWDFDWTEYHKIAAKINTLKANCKAKKKCDKKAKAKCDKKAKAKCDKTAKAKKAKES